MHSPLPRKATEVRVYLFGQVFVIILHRHVLARQWCEEKGLRGGLGKGLPELLGSQPVDGIGIKDFCAAVNSSHSRKRRYVYVLFDTS